mmetsp:Transcript_31837/g.83204  ORF Transcript_31837/g.83204 Transcript_31837/m.83204 type:complete len:264 (+) Transcript_31837:876-1667(+)
MFISAWRSRGPASVTQIPLRPARPVRPERCTYVSVSSRPDQRLVGGLDWTTSSTTMSRPRAATSVAISTRKRPLRNAAITFSRAACGMSPCKHLASTLSSSALASASHSAFVSQKMITLPEALAYMAITSLIVAARWLIGPGAPMARWRTSVDALTSLSPTRSTVVGGVRMYVGATSRTHAGRVAEKRHVWRSSSVHCPRMACMSSAKPMSSIWSASSSAANPIRESSSTPRSERSLIRPGVPITRSTPARSVVHEGPIGVPP